MKESFKKNKLIFIAPNNGSDTRVIKELKSLSKDLK